MNEQTRKNPSSTLVCVNPEYHGSGGSQITFTSLNVKRSKYFVILASFFLNMDDITNENIFFNQFSIFNQLEFTSSETV